MSIEELKAIAESATPGPWSVHTRYSNEIVANGEERTLAETLLPLSDWKDAAHIATFHPARVLQILSDLERMREALEIVRDAAHSDGCGGLCWSDDAAYEAFDNARDCLASLSLTSGGASGKEEG